MSGLMLRWRTILVTCIAAYGVLILGGLVFIYSGAYNVAATDPHWPLTHRLFETARVQSIKARAADITPPAGLDDPSKIVMGTNHFAAHCAVCHGGPGVPKGDIAHGLYPQPPDLAVTAKQYTDAELFWIVKHGIKMTGMPAWADHGDDENWGTVAFLKKLPGMTLEQLTRTFGPEHVVLNLRDRETEKMPKSLFQGRRPHQIPLAVCGTKAPVLLLHRFATQSVGLHRIRQ